MPVIPQTFNKKGRFENNALDYYATPQELADSCLGWLYNHELEPIKSDYDILDVGCGSGVWGVAAKKVNKHFHVTGIDINLEPDKHPMLDVYDNTIKGDYLQYKPLGYDLIMGNPPFSSKENKSLAMDIVLHSLNSVSSNGYVAFLLKTEFLASRQRYEKLFRMFPPKYIVQSVHRIQWINGKKGGNTIEYAFFIWQKGYFKDTIIKWLNWDNTKHGKF